MAVPLDPAQLHLNEVLPVVWNASTHVTRTRPAQRQQISTVPYASYHLTYHSITPCVLRTLARFYTLTHSLTLIPSLHENKDILTTPPQWWMARRTTRAVCAV